MNNEKKNKKGNGNSLDFDEQSLRDSAQKQALDFIKRIPVEEFEKIERRVYVLYFNLPKIFWNVTEEFCKFNNIPMEVFLSGFLTEYLMDIHRKNLQGVKICL